MHFQGRMLILDLMAELNPQYVWLDSFFGQPYIWCMLHNFGGTLGMRGTADRVNTVIKCLKFEHRTFMLNCIKLFEKLY